MDVHSGKLGSMDLGAIFAGGEAFGLKLVRLTIPYVPYVPSQFLVVWKCVTCITLAMRA